jgi:hypothetical protein
MSKYEGQGGFGSSDMYGDMSPGGGNSMFDAATTQEAAALAAAKVCAMYVVCGLSLLYVYLCV